MPTPDGFVLAETRRRQSRRGVRRWVGRLAVLVVVALVVGAGWVAWERTRQALFTASCRATASGTSVAFTPEQTANAALIAAISVRRGLPPRAATIALATAIQESKLRNLTYGDRDSLGLFQQRPSQGWGTREEILDPVHATNAFYDALVKVPDYTTRAITEVAQAVQRSGFPEAYADHEQEGRVLASALTGQSPGGLGCRLAPVGDVGPTSDATAVAADLTAQFGDEVARDGSRISVGAADAAHAWAVGHWAVARAEAYGLARVEVAGKVWQRGEGDDALTWSDGGSANATAVVIQLGSPTG